MVLATLVAMIITRLRSGVRFRVLIILQEAQFTKDVLFASAKVKDISASARNGVSRGGESPFVKGIVLGFTPTRFMLPSQWKLFPKLPV